ncbi:hypothetical protein V8G54_022222 [Vigna mungo]|uniref:Uncharacterized protein n=1 Tax=Vigna mungo TaxID=3915 RepID=A0AAQ3NFL9_VIGMU
MASKDPRSKIDHESRVKRQKVSFNLLEKYFGSTLKGASMWENELLDVGYQSLCIQIPYTVRALNFELRTPASRFVSLVGIRHTPCILFSMLVMYSLCEMAYSK